MRNDFIFFFSFLLYFFPMSLARLLTRCIECTLKYQGLENQNNTRYKDRSVITNKLGEELLTYLYTPRPR
ncbi:hypothetical protein P170DRAFT_157746 [Aspergillus steynii IBT 23096]|uniref:Secreted protein n=1 Tax=Aspergillus steynii IBT 23096 TaxID=1392250 RepID=A0A2I2GDL7_9EURO|nr:uncharacterized protein P170DRAFT_157746 [Aspergillus steynii IBT 23096]PLB50996.1 hypothetical protein P170DRAFT_157746 [Aspergillus steynii IBT 23096]